MGQRLNIEIKNNEKVLANCYYHWSGYTISSLIITKQIIDYLEENGARVSSDVQGAIELLIITGASFGNDSEKGIVSGDIPECNGRNNGLIAVDEKNMKATRYWEEGRIEINIENKTFNFECADEKDYIEYDDIWEKISELFYKIKELDDIIAWQIPFSKIDILISGIEEAQKNYNGWFYFNNYCYGSIY